MYQGKFDAKKKKTSVDVTELVSQRNAAPARKAAPQKKAPAGEEVKVPAEEELLTRRKVSAAKKAAAEAAPAKEEAKQQPAAVTEEIPAVIEQPQQEEAPAKTRKELKAEKKAAKKAEKSEKKAAKKAEVEVEVEPAPEKKRKGPRLGGVIFYTLYFLFILLFFVALFFGLRFLQGWLANFEAAQPTVKAQAVFDQIFTDPDWDQLYDAAGISGTTFEGKEAYIAYIENKVGDSELNYLETSTGLSTDCKYIVRLGDEKIASFTLSNTTESETDIPNWKLSAVELFYECKESYLIQKMDGHTAYVNGVALDDNYTIQIATTVAERYLPAGTTGVNLCTQQITGLMSMPTVTIQDEKGNEMEVTYDEATRTFVEQTSANTITEEQQTVALEAVKAYSRFMIKEGDRGDIAQYFDASSDTYTSIVKSETTWMQDHNGYRFANETVSDYCRYSDDLFSVRVSMSLNITRTDGTVKETPVDQSLFFELQDSGKWLCFEMTSVDVSEPVGKVRLTFKNGDTVLFSDFVENDASELNTPVVSVPEGKVFSGWVREDIDENGRKTLTVEFTPDETGYVKLPANSILEPMTLEAFFENAPTAPAETEGA